MSRSDSDLTYRLCMNVSPRIEHVEKRLECVVLGLGLGTPGTSVGDHPT
jgi:hypothetical protein